MSKPARPSPYAILWPPKYHLYVYEEVDGCLDDIEDTTDRKYDLNDNLFQLEEARTLLLGVEINSPRWPVWDEETVQWIEKRITWDLEFDGNTVALTRNTPELMGQPCTEEFRWQVRAEL